MPVVRCNRSIKSVERHHSFKARGKIAGTIEMTRDSAIIREGESLGRVPKRFKGTDCKSVIRRFESGLGLFGSEAGDGMGQTALLAAARTGSLASEASSPP